MWQIALICKKTPQQTLRTPYLSRVVRGQIALICKKTPQQTLRTPYLSRVVRDGELSPVGFSFERAIFRSDKQKIPAILCVLPEFFVRYGRKRAGQNRQSTVLCRPVEIY